MNKKKLLIVNKSFETGGVQMALANMLEEIHDDYDITLAIFNPHGPMLKRVPENVKILKLSPLVEVLGMSLEDCKEYGSVFQLLFKIFVWVWAKTINNNTVPVAIALATQKNVGEYDAVISYHHENSSRASVSGFGKFALRKCTAKKKIAWVHADFGKTNFATKRNLRTYEKFDKIVCVSKTSADVFLSKYPTLKDKCDYCYNFLPVNDIVRKSESAENVFDREKNEVILFSACRLFTEKGIAPALLNLSPVFERHQNLKWYIAGTGRLDKELKDLVKGKNLENQVFFLGLKENPYPYIKQADYVFVPSLFETYSMVITEAHILGTPAVTSDIPIMREVLNNTDYLCKDNDFAQVIENLITKNRTGCLPERIVALPDRKTQFERILEC